MEGGEDVAFGVLEIGDGAHPWYPCGFDDALAAGRADPALGLWQIVNLNVLTKAMTLWLSIAPSRVLRAPLIPGSSSGPVLMSR